MQLAYPLFATPIVLQENIVNVVVIENSREFYKLSQEFVCAQQNGESALVLSQDFEPISLSKNADVVFSNELLELNSKKILQRLYKNLRQKAHNETFYLRTAELQSCVMQYVHTLCDAEPLPLVFEELDVEVLLKGMEIRFDLDEGGLAEKVCAYIDIMSAYFGVHLFCFFHLKSYLDENDLQKVYQHCAYQKEQLMLFESMERPCINGEKLLIIDFDLCQIT